MIERGDLGIEENKKMKRVSRHSRSKMLPINSVHLGDCLELMKGIPDNSVDMILCDLPYETTAAKWDVLIPFDKLWEEYNRIIKKGRAIVLTAVQPFTSMVVSSNISNFKHEWIWDKVTARGHLVAKKRPMQQHESILVFSSDGGGILYNPQMIDRPKDKIEKRNKTEYKRTELVGGVSKTNQKESGEYTIYDKWYPKTIITISNAGSSVKSVHPTQKPVELFEYLIKTYTNEGDLVLDNCAGSGTTAIAAMNTKRNYILMEKEEKYFDIINKRIEQYQDEKSFLT